MSSLTPDARFRGIHVDDAGIQRTVDNLKAHNIEAIVVEAAEAKDKILSLIPEGSEVFTASSKTLDALHVTDAIDNSGKFISLKKKTFSMDRATQAAEIRKITAAPDYMLVSAHALSQEGELFWLSATGSQLGAITNGAGTVIVVVGLNKIVPDAKTAEERIVNYSYPLEDARAHQVYGVGSAINFRLRVAAISGWSGPRMKVVIVKQDLGF